MTPPQLQPPHRRSTPIRRTLLSAALTGGLGLATQAAAQAPVDDRARDAAATPQDAGSPGGQVVEIDRVTVSAASRISRPGFDAPTPTTSLDAEELQVGARSNIAAFLNELPQFKNTSSPRTDGTVQGGARAPVDLRGLGSGRTLVLLDGRRFKGDDDLNTVPSILVGGADVVTGGASAAWGSGAVAGVVNLTIDERLVGAKVDLRTGISDDNDAEEQAFGVAVGSAFAGGRGHVVFGAEYYNNEGITPRTRREHFGRWSQISNGDGTFTITPDVRSATAVVGGVIRSGVLSGKAFNPDGTLRDHDFGRVVGSSSIGGDGPALDDYAALLVPSRNYRLLGRAIYDVTDSVKLTAQVRHARAYGDFKRFFDNDTTPLTIGIDNAFLPEAVRSTLQAAGETSFRLGRWNSDYGWPDLDYDRRIDEFTVALDGRIGDTWRWDTHYSHGEYAGRWSTPGFLLRENYALAVDSVIDPATGQAVCRIALTDPGTDCVPLNVFGDGAASAEAIAYVQGHPWRQERERLDVAGLGFQGDWLQLPAGPLSVSFGLDLRREEIVHRVSAEDEAGAHRLINYFPLSGSYLVREAFGEALIPLVANAGVLNDLELNLAARFSDYDTVGGVWQWKVGATNEFFPGFKGRTSLSRDVRAPGIGELYATGGIAFGTVADPFTGTNVAYTSYSGGNPDLTPEESDTFTIGVSYSPPAIAGLSVSLDYFSIDIDQVITTVGISDALGRCFNGNQALCDQITRLADGSIAFQSVPVNLAHYTTDGIDLDIAYATPASRLIPSLGGGLNFRLLGSWIHSLKTDDGIAEIEYVDNLGSGLGVPRLQFSGLASYQGNRFGGNVRVRHIAAGNQSNTVAITNNHIGSHTYFDLGLRARLRDSLSSQVELYANVNNLFDKAPPIGAFNARYHDVIGRYYTLGLRLNF
ncbi:TonB-dependent receptor [Luteimonas sp. Y-2-2-4F]|nr:TonB-dependent receptor [Luteimonas sp. Y-2-2-4F]MCD9032261.1 TonB-dependent receptor [Luteimonas sp. Y-2-2-4F]